MYEYEEVRIKMDLIQKNLLEQVAGLHEIPEGAYNIRANGTKLGRNTTANIDIVTKTDKDYHQTGNGQRECTHSGSFE